MGKVCENEGRQMAKADWVYLAIFAFRPALGWEVKRKQTIGTGSIIYQATLTCAETKPPRGDVKSSDRFHPTHKCTHERVIEWHRKVPQYLFLCVKSLKIPIQMSWGRRGDCNTLKPCQLWRSSFELNLRNRYVAISQSSEGRGKIIKRGQQLLQKALSVPCHVWKNLKT